MIPEHTLYCEPFAGGATLFFFKEPSTVEVLNDINGELVNFYRVIQNHLEEFMRYSKYLLKAREEYERFWKTPPEILTDVQRAVRFFYLLRNTFAADINSPNPYFAREYAHIRLGGSFFSLSYIEEFLFDAHRRLRDVIIEKLDFEECIKIYDREDAFFYLDPPYIGHEHEYGEGFSTSDWERLREVLEEMKGKFILSLNKVEEAYELFGKWVIKEVNLTYSRSRKGNKRVTELLIANFELNLIK